MTWEEVTEDFGDQSRIASRSLGYGYKAVVTEDDDLLIRMFSISEIGSGILDLDEELGVVDDEFGSEADRQAIDWEVL